MGMAYGYGGPLGYGVHHGYGAYHGYGLHHGYGVHHRMVKIVNCRPAALPPVKRCTMHCTWLTEANHVCQSQLGLCLYKSFIQSHLEYCLPIWGAGPEKFILEKMQKWAVRVVTNSKYNAHADPIFARLQTLKLTDLYKLRCIEIGTPAVQQYLVPGLNSTYEIASAAVQTRYHGKTKLKIPPTNHKQPASLPHMKSQLYIIQKVMTPQICHTIKAHLPREVRTFLVCSI